MMNFCLFCDIKHVYFCSYREVKLNWRKSGNKPMVLIQRILIQEHFSNFMVSYLYTLEFNVKQNIINV